MSKMSSAHELYSFQDGKPQLQTRTTVSTSQASSLEKDQIELARLGKKQVLKRNFGLLSMTGFSCGLMATWEAILIVFTLGNENGGPSGLLYGLVLVTLGTISTFTVLGELASMAPTAGGQYHWVNLLAPPKAKNFLSYITGWLTVAGWCAAVCASAIFGAQMIQTLAQLNYPDYSPTTWQNLLIFWAILIVCLGINTLMSGFLPILETLVLILHVLGFFAIALPLFYLAPHSDPKAIFTTFTNNGGWSSQGLSFFIGLNGNALAFVGTDGPVHMCEEVKNPAMNVPRSMVYSVIINGVLSIVMMIVMLLCSGDPSVYSGSPLPFIPIFAAAFQSKVAATGVTCIILVIQFVTSVGGLAAASRMVWSFSRDRGLPGWRTLSKVDSKSTMPLASLTAVSVICGLLGLINIGSTTAFNDIISLTLEALFSSYLLACGLLLYRRIRGEIRDFDPNFERTPTSPHTWGPWHLSGTLGTLNNIFSCCYLTIITFFSFWPTAIPVSPTTMNYSSLVVGSIVIFSTLYYVTWAKKIYKGPVVEITL